MKPEQVFSGVGSDDVLAMCFLTFFNSKKPIFFPDVTYGFYPVWSELFQIPYEKKPLNDRFELVKEDYYAENGGIVFPNPNAPTGIALSVADIEDIIQHNPDSIVIVDEAYIDFGGTSVLPLIDKYDNLIVVQTFSKSRSMAGMRIGFAVSNPTLIRVLNDCKFSFNSYTMNQTTIAAGVAAVSDRAYLEETVAKIVATREHAKKVLAVPRFSEQFPVCDPSRLFCKGIIRDAERAAHFCSLLWNRQNERLSADYDWNRGADGNAVCSLAGIFPAVRLAFFRKNAPLLHLQGGKLIK